MSQGFTKGTPIDTDPTLSLNSDIVVPSQSAVVAYVASQVGTPVSSVTASAPLVSSGGLTPNISIPVATTLVNGYLSAADWTNFNTAYTNRITSLTTTGSSGASTLSSNTLNIPNYTLSGLGGVPTSRTLTINGTSYDLSADRSWTIAAGGTSATIGATIDGSGGTITVGQKGYVQIPYACTINSWRIIANASGSIVIDIYKAAAPTIPVTSITGSAKPTLSTQQTAASSTLTGWTTSIAANDIIGFNVDSATTVSWVILQIFVTKT